MMRFCRLGKNNNGVPPNKAYTPLLFQHVFLPNSCNNDDENNDDDDTNGFVMIMMIVIMVKMLR